MGKPLDMSDKKTILVLTSGGLSPALNATLYGVIKQVRKYRWRILGGINGWISLVQQGKIIDLTNLNVEAIKNRGGDFLRSSRTNPFKIPGGINLLKEKIKKYRISGILAIGGDDTLKGASQLFTKEHLPIVGLPKTVDNDLPLTYFSPGFPSAAYYAAKLAAETKEDSAYTLSRVFIIEMYGEKSGWLAAAAALGGVDLVIPPEWPFKLNDILKLIQQKYEKNGNYCVVALSKEAKISGLKSLADTQPDDFNNQRREFISLALKEKIESRLGLSAKIIIPMNYVQSGEPIKLDWEMGVRLGKKGVDLIKENRLGQTLAIDFKNNRFALRPVSLKIFSQGIKKKMPASFFNKKTMLPTEKYFKYLKTLIGNFQFIDKNYQKLQQIISKKMS